MMQKNPLRVADAYLLNLIAILDFYRHLSLWKPFEIVFLFFLHQKSCTKHYFIAETKVIA